MNILTIEPQPKIKPFHTFGKYRYKVAYGGRGSGKTWGIAEALVIRAAFTPTRVLCGRELQLSIKESVLQVLADTIDRLNLGAYFDVQAQTIYGKQDINKGTQFIFSGIKSNPTKIKSMEGIDICWLEESENLSEESLDLVIPTIRKPGSEIWFSFNPRNILDETYQRFVVNTPPDTYLVKVNWDDNPWFPIELKNEMENLYESDPVKARHIWGGEPVGDSEYAIINPVWIEAAIDAHIKLGFDPSGRKVIGYDIADNGGDTNARCYAHGSVVYDCIEWHGELDGILKSCKLVYGEASRTGSEIIYDSVGVGASAGGKFNELNNSLNGSIKHGKFVAGGKVANPTRKYTTDKTNADMFSNAKAQAWWYVADRFRNTYDAVTNGTKYPEDALISISSKCGNLASMCAELSRPRVDYDGNDRVKVESKKDMKKRDIPSPNMADALIMCFIPNKPKGISLTRVA